MIEGRREKEKLHLLNIYIKRWYDVLNFKKRNEIDKLLNQIRERLNQLEHHS